MSEAVAFDTHRDVKRLTDCGFTEKQAETLADEHVALLNANLATKADIAKVALGSAATWTICRFTGREFPISGILLASSIDTATAVGLSLATRATRLA